MKFLDQDISPIGMGCWAIGGPFYLGDEPLGYGEVDDAESTRAIHAALEAGIRLFDTANVYGAGHSERVLGAALTGHPEALIVSKFGMRFDEDTKQVLDGGITAQDVIPEIDASLRRLGRDRIDVMLLHLNALPVDQASPLFDALETAREAGKIRAYGWSTDFPDSARAMAGRPGFVAVQHAVNVFRDAPTMQGVVEAENLTALIRSPLAMGILTGKFDGTSTIPQNDVRVRKGHWHDYFSDGKVTPKYLDRLGAIRELLQTGGRSPAQGALGWLLAKSPRNLPIPGARNVAQVQENAGALSHGPLPQVVMDELEVLIQRQPEGPPQER